MRINTNPASTGEARVVPKILYGPEQLTAISLDLHRRVDFIAPFKFCFNSSAIMSSVSGLASSNPASSTNDVNGNFFCCSLGMPSAT